MTAEERHADRHYKLPQSEECGSRRAELSTRRFQQPIRRVRSHLDFSMEDKDIL